jgi:hypothetical protein
MLGFHPISSAPLGSVLVTQPSPTPTPVVTTDPLTLKWVLKSRGSQWVVNAETLKWILKNRNAKWTLDDNLTKWTFKSQTMRWIIK